MKKIRVAAIQMCSSSNREENIFRVLNFMEEAVSQKAKIIALPENFSYMRREGERIPTGEDLETGYSINVLKEFAKKHHVSIIGGSIILKCQEKDKFTNTCLVISPEGQIVGRYDKMHLFDACLQKDNAFQESLYIQRGQKILTVKLFEYIIGVSICYDLRFPELYRALVLQNAVILFVPAAFTYQTGKAHWEILLRARAIENLCYVVAPAQVGQHHENRKSFGQTMIVDPWGKILSQCQDEEAVLVYDLDMEYLKQVRQRLSCLKHMHKDTFFSPGILK